MKKFFRISLMLLVLPAIVLITAFVCQSITPPSFRDLNKNGTMDIYEDNAQPLEKRIDDLLKKMTLEEKAGMMFINGTRINDDGSLDDKPGQGMFSFAPQAPKLILEKKMNHFNVWAIPGTKAVATWYNNVQKFAEEKTRLGIPITLASDPRNAFSDAIFAMAAMIFHSGQSNWDLRPLAMRNLCSNMAT